MPCAGGPCTVPAPQRQAFFQRCLLTPPPTPLEHAPQAPPHALGRGGRHLGGHAAPVCGAAVAGHQAGAHQRGAQLHPAAPPALPARCRRLCVRGGQGARGGGGCLPTVPSTLTRRAQGMLCFYEAWLSEAGLSCFSRSFLHQARSPQHPHPLPPSCTERRSHLPPRPSCTHGCGAERGPGVATAA